MENQEPVVSVVMLSYNHEKYLAEALASVVAQETTFFYEIIIHDDASQDRSQEIIQEFVARYPDRFVAILQKENQYSKDINFDCRQIYPRCRGKYLAFCEGDDYWTDPKKLQKQFQVMEKDPDLAICVHQVVAISEGGMTLPRTYPTKEQLAQTGKASTSALVPLDYPFHTTSFFIRKTALEPLMTGNTALVHYFNGDEVLLRLSLIQGEVYYLHEAMSVYRQFSEGSWSTRQQQLTKAEQVQKITKLIQGYRVFDEESGYAYHELLQEKVFSFNLALCQYDVGASKENWQQVAPYLTSWLAKAPLKRRMQHGLFQVWPGLYQQLFKFRRAVLSR